MSIIPGRLDGDEIKKKIEASLQGDFRPSNEELNEILQRFWHQDAYDSLISFPDYLEHLVAFLNNKRSINFTRSEFISFMIERIIGDKKLLQKLKEFSVVMELLQANEVELNKLLEIFNKLEVQNPETVLEKLKNKLMLEEKTVDSKSLVGFRHHSIQEYLATRLILETKNPLETTKQLVMLEREGLVAVKPSWYNVIRFLLESELSQEVANWLISLGKENPQIIEEGYSNALSYLDSSKTLKETQTHAFDLIYNTYQQRAVWFPLWTRQSLVKLCQSQHLRKFREDIKPTGDTTSTVVHQGNVVEIISRLLENKSPLMPDEEKGYWKPKLVEFANGSNENGVLQRHALSALATYEEPGLIAQVAKAFEHPDKLVKEAFVQFCYETDANHQLTVKYLVEGVKKGIDIYGRYGIYEVDSGIGIKELLTYFANDEAFLKRFLDRESIFNKEDRKGDSVLIKHIKQNLDSDTVKLIKNVIKTAYQSDRIYQHERSYFLEQLVGIVYQHDKDYIFEAINDIEVASGKNRWHLLCNYEELFAQIIQPDQLKRFFHEIPKLNDGKTRAVELTVYKAKYRQGDKGERLYQEAVKLKLIKRLRPQPQQVSTKDKKLYQEFLRLLEPSKGKYFPTVFGFFNDNQKVLEPHLTKQNKQRLAKLVVEEGLQKINPTQIKVAINWSSDQSGKQYSISTVASYYGELLKTAKIFLSPKVLHQYRQNIINFIPFAFSEDQQVILEITEPVTDSELRWVNQEYLNRRKDTRYLNPSSYIYLVKHHLDKGTKLKSALPILKSFIQDNKLPNYDREYALRQIEGLISRDDNQTKKILKRIFDQCHNDAENEKLAIIANKALINAYKDKRAINWRFNQLKERLVSFKEPPMEIAHSVGPIEEELDSKWFARPLINLNSDKYIPDFLDILDFSFKQLPLAAQNDYKPYIEYLWAVVIAYFDNLKQQGSFEPLKKLESWLNKNAKGEGLNWLKAQARSLYQGYELYFGAVKEVDTAIEEVEALKT